MNKSQIDIISNSAIFSHRNLILQIHEKVNAF